MGCCEGQSEMTQHGDGKSSTVLYDACFVKSENIRLHHENAVLQARNAELHRLQQGLRRKRKHLQLTKEAAQFSSDSSRKGTAERRGSVSALSQARQTLAMLVLQDSRWERLLHDSDGLFTTDDVFDPGYQEYLRDVLHIMEEHSLSFKDAIQQEALLTVSKANIGEGVAANDVNSMKEDESLGNIFLFSNQETNVIDAPTGEKVTS